MSDLDTPLPQFQQYRDALMQRMERDQDLDRFLAEHGGPCPMPAP